MHAGVKRGEWCTRDLIFRESPVVVIFRKAREGTLEVPRRFQVLACCFILLMLSPLGRSLVPIRYNTPTFFDLPTLL